jgi:hypothetical protein
MDYPKIASYRTPAAFQARLNELGLDLPFDEILQAGPDSPLAQPISADGLEAANRFAVLPMEGWDCTPEGRPSELGGPIGWCNLKGVLMPENQVQQAVMLNGDSFGLSRRAGGVNDIREMLDTSNRSGIIQQPLGQLLRAAVQANVRYFFSG